MNLQIYKFINCERFFYFGVDNKTGDYIILVPEYRVYMCMCVREYMCVCVTEYICVCV